MINGIQRRDDFTYTRLQKELRQQILQGMLRVGDMLPSENSLCEMYQISRSSVRKALANLVDEGLVVKEAGKGTFVAPNPELAGATRTLKVGVYVPALELNKVLKALDIFEQQYPMIKVQPVRISSSAEYPNTVTDLAAAGDLDVFMVSDYHFGDFQPETELVELTSFLPPGWNTERDSYPAVFASFKRGKGLFAMPVVFSPVVLCYNKELFDQAGLPYPDGSWTWERLVETAVKLTREKDGEIAEYGFCFSSSLNRWPIWLMQNGASLRQKGGRSRRFDTPRVEEAVQFAADLMYRHKVSPVYGGGMDHAAEDLFSRGKVAMALTTYFYMNDFRDLEFAWDVAEPPMGRQQGTILLSLGLAVSSHSREPELAQRLVRYFLQESTQEFLKQEGCSVPVLRQVAESRSNLNPAIHPAGYHTFEQTLPYTYLLEELGERTHWHLVDRELALVWANMDSPSSALRRAEERVRDSYR